MTSTDIQLLVQKNIVGRYIVFIDDELFLYTPNEQPSSANRAYVFKARMHMADFEDFRRDCVYAGLSIVAIMKHVEAGRYDFIIAATERMSE